MGGSREVRQPGGVRFQADPWPEGRPLGATATYPTGTKLLRQGEPVRSVHLIERGVIKMIRTEANGRELIEAFRGPGWLLGAAAVILSGTAELTAQCACECHLRSLDSAEFRKTHATDPAMAGWIQRMLAREVREQASRMGHFLLKPAARLQGVLAALAPHAQPDPASAGRLLFPISQYELADAIGTRRETVTRLLKEAERQGVICRDHGWIKPGPR